MESKGMQIQSESMLSFYESFPISSLIASSAKMQDSKISSLLPQL